MLSIRKRGKYFHVRGTVSWGKKSTYVEKSTKLDSRKAAFEYVHDLEEKIINAFKNGGKRPISEVTFDECLDVYLTEKGEDLKVSTLEYINRLLPHYTGVVVSDIKAAFLSYRKANPAQSLSTFERNNSVIKAIINYSAPTLGFHFEKEKRKGKKNKNEVMFHLNDEARENLLKCYSTHAEPIFRVYSLQGFREQELLQLDWNDVKLDKKEIFIRKSKNGESRSVPMNLKTWWILARHWIKSNKPMSGHVFLNSRGQPYTDTRLGAGGSPIRKAHILALDRFKESYGFIPKNSLNQNMRVHDWRHDWASRCVMAGVDLLTLQRLGGWKSLDMVKRYATFSKDHEHVSINKI